MTGIIIIWTLSSPISTLLCFIMLSFFLSFFCYISLSLFSLSIAIYTNVCVLFHQSIDSRTSLSATDLWWKIRDLLLYKECIANCFVLTWVQINLSSVWSVLNITCLLFIMILTGLLLYCCFSRSQRLPKIHPELPTIV